MIDNTYKHGIGPGGRWVISCGVAALPAGIFVRLSSVIERLTGQTGLLVIFFVGAAVLLLLTRVLYRRLQNRTFVIVGTIGWLLGLLLFYLTARAIDH
jgi:hypothetical protein